MTQTRPRSAGKVQTRRVISNGATTERPPKEAGRTVSAELQRENEALAEVVAEACAEVEEDAPVEEAQEDEAPRAFDDESYTDYVAHDDAADEDVDVETLEESGPGQFLMRRNAELVRAIGDLRGEVEAMRRLAENEQGDTADRIVRAIDRVHLATRDRTKGTNRLLALVALLNAGLIGLTVYSIWPDWVMSVLPV